MAASQASRSACSQVAAYVVGFGLGQRDGLDQQRGRWISRS